MAEKEDATACSYRGEGLTLQAMALAIWQSLGPLLRTMAAKGIE